MGLSQCWGLGGLCGQLCKLLYSGVLGSWGCWDVNTWASITGLLLGFR